MLEPTLERLPVRFRLGEHEGGTLFIICEPMQTPTATDHPLLSRGSITFTCREGTTLEQATDMALLRVYEDETVTLEVRYGSTRPRMGCTHSTEFANGIACYGNPYFAKTPAKPIPPSISVCPGQYPVSGRRPVV